MRNAGAKRTKSGKIDVSLLDEDRYSAPDDFVYREGYIYFDMKRNYVNQVRSNFNAFSAM